MGQYYMPIFITENGDVSTLYAHEFDNGLKLMEHSYIGNYFVNAALSLIENTPLRVAWIGDYSDDPYEDLYSTKMAKEDFLRHYGMAWNEKDLHKLSKDTFAARKLSSLCTMKTNNKYLINHTEKKYVHFGEYIAASKWSEKGAWENGRYNAFASYDMCIHPLPLLTACGNDRGGGDYREGHPCYEQVGLWAFDLLEYAAKVPKGYEKVVFYFSEQKTVDPIERGEVS